MGLYGPGGHYLPHYDAFDTLVAHQLLIISVSYPISIFIINNMIIAFITIAVIMDQT